MLSLSSLSKYVGMHVPGKNSFISSIHILKNEKNYKENKFIFFSRRLKSVPLLYNYLFFKDYTIIFSTAIRPTLNIKKIPKPTKNLIKNFTKLKKNILIIGASSGIGYELMSLFKHNKKIKIFASYYKNAISLKSKNLYKFKLDIEKDLKKIVKIIKKNQPINVYYFATPKINFIKTNISFKDKYKKYYCDYPSKILRSFTNNSNGFFYPSSILAKKKETYYSKYKAIGENLMNKLKKEKVADVRIARLPGLKTKQNITIIKNTYPFFTNYLQTNTKLLKQLLFE